MNGTDYGVNVNDLFAPSRKVSIPKGLDLLVEAIHVQSALLKLAVAGAHDAVVARIYDAYGSDLLLLDRYRTGFKTTIEAAIRARADSRHVDAVAMLAAMVAGLPDLAHDPKLELGAGDADLAPSELIQRLQLEFRTDVESLRDGIVLWLNTLVERDVVSVIEWHNPRAATYHFFKMHSTRGPTDSKKVDPGMHHVGRHVTTTETTAVEVVNERREHTILNANRYALGEYRERVPRRIAAFINEIPTDVRPFVEIVDGTVSKEDVTRQVNERVDTQTRAVWVKDPAPVLFGTWALAGWGGSSDEAARTLYDGHVVDRANKWLVVALLLTAVCAAGAVPLAGGRGALMVVIIGAILTALSQLGMRIRKT